MPTPRDRRSPAAPSRSRRRNPLRQPPPAQGPLSRTASRRRCSASAASGARRRRSGRSPASMSPRSAMPAATRPTRPIRRCAAGMTGHNEVVLVVYDPKVDQLRGAAQGVLRGPRPDAGHAPGQRRRHPVPLGHLRRRRGAAADRRGGKGDVRQGARRARATGRSPPRSSTGRPSTSPRTTTSSISPRTRTAIAASAAPASPARSVSRAA